MIGRVKLALATIVFGLAATAVAGAAGIGPLSGYAGDAGEAVGPQATAARGAVVIADSRRGEAILEASNMVPGSVARGSVRLVNRGSEQFALSLAPLGLPSDRLARALRVELRDHGAGPQAGSLYRGPLASMPPIPLGSMAPGHSRTYDLAARLPADAGDRLQGLATSVDFSWRARAAGPPPECRVRAMRARLFVFRNRNVIRLVSRYRAAIGSRVAIDFYERRRGGRRGRKVGTVVTTFRRSPSRFHRARVASVRPPAEMRRYRDSRRGYIATLRVARAPGYCRQHLNLELVELRRYFRQYVWFQRGSFTTRRAGINSGM